MPRPKLDEAATQKICDFIRAGNYLEVAAAAAGIHRTSLHRWIRLGREQKRGRYRRHGIEIQRVVSDNGACYKDRFTTACAELGIWHLRTKAYTPQTNGKAERLIQTLIREWAYVKSYPKSRRSTAALLPYLRYYNRKRPHAGCGALTPMKKLERAA